MIGSLMYLTSSRPDIMFVVCVCARYQVNPKVSHLYAMKRIFRYLKGQPKLGLWYQKDSPFDLLAYTDSDYAGASLDRNLTTGGQLSFTGKDFIKKDKKKQKTVEIPTRNGKKIKTRAKGEEFTSRISPTQQERQSKEDIMKPRTKVDKSSKFQGFI
ncbi:hypothetical protein Tco_0656062 [Tanacetum coccineum]|uniref:Uncharacterized protein n=1 Tax=Tanacetum coccineum TaxID=301880 RepID=A0ABQ4X882_9ASTR